MKPKYALMIAALLVAAFAWPSLAQTDLLTPFNSPFQNGTILPGQSSPAAAAAVDNTRVSLDLDPSTSTITLSGTEVVTIEDTVGVRLDSTTAESRTTFERLAFLGPDLLTANLNGKDVMSFDSTRNECIVSDDNTTASNAAMGYFLNPVGSGFTLYIVFKARQITSNNGDAVWSRDQLANFAAVGGIALSTTAAAPGNASLRGWYYNEPAGTYTEGPSVPLDTGTWNVLVMRQRPDGVAPTTYVKFDMKINSDAFTAATTITTNATQRGIRSTSWSSAMYIPCTTDTALGDADVDIARVKVVPYPQLNSEIEDTVASLQGEYGL